MPFFSFDGSAEEIAQELERTIQEIQDAFFRAVRESIPELAELLQNDLKRTAPVRTGKLKRSLRVEALPQGPGLRVFFAFYAPFLKPDIIEASFQRITPEIVPIVRRRFDEILS